MQRAASSRHLAQTNWTVRCSNVHQNFVFGMLPCVCICIGAKEKSVKIELDLLVGGWCLNQEEMT